MRRAFVCLALAACGIDVVGIGAELDEQQPGTSDSGVADGAPLPVAEASTTSDAHVEVDAGEDAAKDAAKPVACTEPGSSVFANHCYFTLTARTQTQAKTDCASAGAHLVTVTSLPEHQHVATVGTGDRWIGLQAASPTNDRAQYKWITGESSPVTYWYPNDPDNMGPCVAFRSALELSQSWVDRGCTESNVAICERE